MKTAIPMLLVSLGLGVPLSGGAAYTTITDPPIDMTTHAVVADTPAIIRLAQQTGDQDRLRDRDRLRDDADQDQDRLRDRDRLRDDADQDRVRDRDRLRDDQQDNVDQLREQRQQMLQHQQQMQEHRQTMPAPGHMN